MSNTGPQKFSSQENVQGQPKGNKHFKEYQACSAYSEREEERSEYQRLSSSSSPDKRAKDKEYTNQGQVASNITRAPRRPGLLAFPTPLPPSPGSNLTLFFAQIPQIRT